MCLSDLSSLCAIAFFFTFVHSSSGGGTCISHYKEGELSTVGDCQGSRKRELIKELNGKVAQRGPCEIFDPEEGCFWSAVGPASYGNYTKAIALCSQKGSVTADILSEKIYNKVMNGIRTKMGRMPRMCLWTGLKLDVSTGDLIQVLSGAFTKWIRSDYPLIGSSFQSFTHVCLQVTSDPLFPEQGIKNILPATRLYGVVCQTKI